MRTLTVGKARLNLNRLIDQVARSHQPLGISGCRHRAVLEAAEDWESRRAAFGGKPKICI